MTAYGRFDKSTTARERAYQVRVPHPKGKRNHLIERGKTRPEPIYALNWSKGGFERGAER